MKKFYVRKVNIQDKLDIYKWRNDYLTRRMCINSEQLDKDLHEKWFNASIISEEKIFLICEDKNVGKFCFVRFDLLSEYIDISIVFNPLFRGLGYSKDCLRNSIEFITLNYSFRKTMIAKIKKVNFPSQKIFLGLGFKLYKSDENLFYYKKEM